MQNAVERSDDGNLIKGTERISAELNLAIKHVAKRSLAFETNAVGGVHFYRLLRGDEGRVTVVGSHPLGRRRRGVFTTRSSQWNIQQ